MIRSALITLIISAPLAAFAAECPDFSGSYVAGGGQTLKLERGLTGGYTAVDQDHHVFAFYLGHAELGDGDTMDVTCADGKISLVESTERELDLETDDFAVTGEPAQDARIREMALRARALGQTVLVHSREIFALALRGDSLERTGSSRLEFVNGVTAEALVVDTEELPLTYGRAVSRDMTR